MVALEAEYEKAEKEFKVMLGMVDPEATEEG